MDTKPTKQNIGSDWRKWDLHVHSPASIRQNYGGEESWEIFIADLEKLPEEFKVIGINDYLFLEGYERVLEYKKDGRLKNIDLILPVLEFRLGEFAGVDFGEYKRPNLHVIFADENVLETGLITSQFLATLDAEYKLEKDGENFHRTLTKESLKELGQQIIDSVPEEEKLKYETPEVEGFNNLNLTFKQIKDSLNKDCFKDKYILAIGKTEWDQLKWSEASIASKKTLINSCKIIFTASESVHSFQNAKTKLSEQKVNDLLLDCSDAHSFSNAKDGDENLLKDRIGNCFTWIKAEPTFEGLKQIIYEPNQGVRHIIKDGFPKKPINTIDSITLKIPSGAKVGEDSFCFAGNNNTYNLSPYFNCFIGSRGSGKSTLLNFLGLSSNNSVSSKLFWSGDTKDKKGLNPSGFDPNSNEIFSFKGTEIFEFLAQSEIETFARDKVKFTQAIYDRANGPRKTLQTFEDNINKYQNDLDRIVEAIADMQELLSQKTIKEKEKRSLENTKNIIESKDYERITNSISELTQKIQVHKKWSDEAYSLKVLLSDLVESYSEILVGNSDQIKYKDSLLLVIGKVKEAIEILEEKNFDKVKKEEQSHRESLLLLEEELKKLLNKGNFSEDNIEQIRSAPQKIVVLEQEIEQIGFQIEGKNKIIATFDGIVLKLKTDKENYEQKIQEIINPLQELLEKQFEENQGEDIKKISLEYSFNERGAWTTLSEEFHNYFYSKYHDSERSKEVCEFIIKNQLTFALDSFNDIKKLVQQPRKGDMQYIKFLDEIFKDEKNFQIFRSIRDKHLYDVKTNKIIQVKYDNKEIEQASFGQRCTAVVVILLLFGNYPLIIDEPEAHLDSSLIANYLVPLLKEKKSDRQIIFATHNANFVINGDAEKIFILKNQSGRTEIIETTIENVANRKELLKLEGGKEAFKKRGEKLNIR